MGALNVMQRDALRAAQGGKCSLCDEEIPTLAEEPSDAESEEHVIPKAAGGADSFGNILLAHVSCNKQKANRSPTRAELAKLYEIMARIPPAVVNETIKQRIGLMGGKSKRPRIGTGGAVNASAKAIQALAPFVEPAEMRRALDPQAPKPAAASAAATPSRPTALAPAILATSPPAREETVVPRAESRTSRRSAVKVARAYPRMAFGVAAVTALTWLGSLLADLWSGSAANAHETFVLIGAVHLVLVLAPMDRLRSPNFSKFASWMFLLGALALLMPSQSRLSELLPQLSDFAAFVSIDRFARMGGVVVLTLGWLVIFYIQAVKGSPKPSPAARPTKPAPGVTVLNAAAVSAT